MTSDAEARPQVAPHLCRPGKPKTSGEVLCLVCGVLVDAVYWPGPQPRASVPEMVDEFRAKRTTFTATFRFRTGSNMPDEVPMLVDVGREMETSRKRREALR